jgi:hypothetical protein
LGRLKQAKYNKPHWLRYILGISHRALQKKKKKKKKKKKNRIESVDRSKPNINVDYSM